MRYARTLQIGEEVQVYRNLHTGKISVRGKTDKGWRVIAHVDVIHLKDVKFKVNETGRQRVLRERVKNVHAFVLGRVSEPFLSEKGVRVSYNPYKVSQFVMGAYQVYKANKAVVAATGEIYI